MAVKLDIEGVGPVEIGDEFNKLSPDQQNQVVAHIAQQAAKGVKSAIPAGPKPDKYQQSAQDTLASLKEKGLADNPYKQRLLSGMTLGASDEILAGLETPLQMLKHGTINPAEGYRYAKAIQDEQLKQARQNTGLLGDVTEAAGGILTGGKAAQSGLTLLRAGQSLPARAGAMAGEGAAYGGITGFNEGNGLSDRLTGAAGGATIGGLLGGSLPLVGAAARTVASPVVSNVMARIDPESAARARVGRAIGESTVNPYSIPSELGLARAEGQGEYRLADVLGNPGQRLLSTATRAPGEGRTMGVEFLENRQAGQSRRVANALAEGFDAPQTAQQHEANLIAQRKAAANQNYGDARLNAGAVNVTPALQEADRVLSPGVNRLMAPGSQIPDNSIEAVVRRARGMLANGQEQLSDFGDVLFAKREIDNLIESGTPSQQRALIPIRNALDTQLEAASPEYANARDTFRNQSRAIESIQTGRGAAQRGRFEDTTRAYSGMSPEERAAFRVGYADPIIEQTTNAAPGVNKVRPLMAEGVQREIDAFASPGRANRLQRQLARENTMFETRRQATGGSQTAENLADQAENQIDPRVFAQLAHGNILGAGREFLRGAGNVIGGNTPEVRRHLAEMLLANDPQAVTGLLGKLSDEKYKAIARDLMMRKINRGLLAGEGEYVGERVNR